MRVTLSLPAFLFLGIAAAGVVPEIAVRDDTVAGGNDSQGAVTFGFTSVLSNLPEPTEFLPIPVDVGDRRKPTGKHSRFAASRRGSSANTCPPGFPSGSSDLPKPTSKPSRPRPSQNARALHPTAVPSIDPILHSARPTEISSQRHHGSPSDCSDDPKPTSNVV